MKTTDIIIAGIAGTTAFTLFSYIASQAAKEDFEEPELLGKMVNRVVPGLDKKQSEFTGWLIHYLVGFALAGGYKGLINKAEIKPTVKNGLITGLLTGFPAALIWDTSLKEHPLPPRKRTMSYYIQLALGHALFGAASFFIFGVTGKYQNEKNAVAPIIDESPDSKLSLYATAGS